MKSVKRNDSGLFGIILAFAGGAAAGAATALLLAPMTGADTRGEIKRFAAGTKDKVLSKAGDLKLPFRKRGELRRNGSV